MNEAEEQLVRDMIEPLVTVFMETYRSAMILRIDVHRCLAVDNGAEAEDMPKVIANAIESAQPLVQKFLDDLGEVGKAQKLGETT